MAPLQQPTVGEDDDAAAAKRRRTNETVTPLVDVAATFTKKIAELKQGRWNLEAAVAGGTARELAPGERIAQLETQSKIVKSSNASLTAEVIELRKCPRLLAATARSAPAPTLCGRLFGSHEQDLRVRTSCSSWSGSGISPSARGSSQRTPGVCWGCSRSPSRPEPSRSTRTPSPTARVQITLPPNLTVIGQYV